jgi:riboflavin biosynthesis pyrimidine reductase
VETIDGVVSIPGVPRSNSVVAGDSDADRFVMGLLRACAGVVLLGAGTLRASPQGTWQPQRIYPDAADAFAELRRSRGFAERVEVAVVTTGRSLDLAHPVLAGALVLTTDAAAADLRAAIPAAEVVAVNDGSHVDLARAIALLHERGHAMILAEAGPKTFGSLLEASLVDELFLTVSPLVAGRGASARPSLAEGVELLPERRDAATLQSVRRSESHLFLRYAFR